MDKMNNFCRRSKVFFFSFIGMIIIWNTKINIVRQRKNANFDRTLFFEIYLNLKLYKKASEDSACLADPIKKTRRQAPFHDWLLAAAASS